MGDKRISELDPASALTGDEVFPIVKGGLTVKATVQQLADLVPQGNQEVFLGIPAVLPNYPALIFQAVTIDGVTVHRMRFNDGIA